MRGATRIERTIDLPRSIVWDALVDPILVEGWLHPSARLVGAERDGALVVERRDPRVDDPATLGVLEVDGDRFGRIRFELAHLAGGTRGSVTRLVLALPEELDERFRAPVVAGWQTRLDQLEDLLRGHPVDWANWERDHGADYENHLLRAAGLARP